MNRIKHRRILAYLMDILIVTTIIMLLSKIEFLNPNIDKYNKAVEDYSKYYKKVEKSMDAKVLLSDEYYDIAYRMNKYSLSTTIMETLVIIMYFTLFPIFNKNQTIGKQLLKIKVKEEKNSKIKLFLRSIVLPIWANIIITNSIVNIISISCIYVLPKHNFINMLGFSTLLICIYCYADILVFLARKDNKSLHDILLKTEVEYVE